MRKALLTTLLMLSTIPALAQSALGIGLHEAENNVDISYTGTGWTTGVDGDYSYVQSEDTGDLVSFSFTGSALLIYRELFFAPVTLAVTGNPTSNGIIGDSANEEWRHAQQFTPLESGVLSQIKITLGVNNNSPACNCITWEIRSDNNNLPGSLLQSATASITPNTQNTFIVSNGVTLDNANKYWLVIYTQAQNTNQYYRWRLDINNPYPNHASVFSTNAGVNWNGYSEFDHIFEIVTLGASDIEVCLDGDCSIFGNYSSTRRSGIPIGLVPSVPGTHDVTIENIGNGSFRLDNLLVLPSSESGGSTVIPIDIQYPAPEDTVSFDVSGQPSSFSYSMSAGDVMTNVLLVALIVLSISQLLVGMLWKN